MSQSHYLRLLAMAALSFIAMYALMYAMVDKPENIRHNLNQLYMAALMTAPMVLIELVLMKEMYGNRKLNALIATLATVALIGFFCAIRQQAAIGDRQFLQSMIPHHAAAILMCEKAPLEDAGVRNLCSRIIESQRAEISEMKEKLAQSGVNDQPTR